MARALGDVGLSGTGRVFCPISARTLYSGRSDRLLCDYKIILDVPFVASDAAPERQRLQPLHDSARVVVLAVHVLGAECAGAGAAAVRLAAAVAAHEIVQPAQLVTRSCDAATPGTRMTLTHLLRVPLQDLQLLWAGTRANGQRERVVELVYNQVQINGLLPVDFRITDGQFLRVLAKYFDVSLRTKTMDRKDEGTGEPLARDSFDRWQTASPNALGCA